MRTLALVALVALVGCSEGQPDVHPGIVDMVEALESDRDCAGLQAAFDRSDDADELRYIDDALSRQGATTRAHCRC